VSSAKLFVDTGAWVALTVEDDAHHKKARQAYPIELRKRRKLITTNFVIAETYTLLRRAAGQPVAVAFLEMLAASPRVEKVFSTAIYEEEAYRLLKQYEDQDFSFVDAVSFAVMKQQNVQDAFAFDKHFQTAGFILVP